MTTPPNRPRRLQTALAAVTVTALATSLALTQPAPAEAEPVTTRTTVVEEQLSTSSARTAASRVWTYRDTSTAPFMTLGISWAVGAKADPAVQFRTRSGGTWSAWTTAEVTAANPAEAERAGTDPVYVGRADGVEVKVTTSRGRAVVDPTVTLIDPGNAPTPAPAKQSAATSGSSVSRYSTSAVTAPPKPAVVSRAQWGADETWRCSAGRYTSTVQAAIVHHTAGVNSYTKAESAGIVRGIYAYHTKTLGWCDLGYNVLVDKYGQVFEGRSGGLEKPVLGSHATSWNTDTVGLSFMGNFETAAAPAAMLESGAKVIAWKFGIHNRDPRSKVTLAGKYINRISGHGDVMSTACPGLNVRSKLPWLRDRVAALMAAPATSTPAPSTGTATTEIGKRWEALGGANSFLGWPVDVEKKVADGTWREYRKHDMFDSPRTSPQWTTGGIRDRYRQLGTATSTLGFPTSDEKSNWPVTGMAGNTFEKGAIVWSKAHSSHVLHGAFARTWSADPALQKRLGAPSTDQERSPFGTAWQTFDGGRLFENKGVWVMEGAIHQHWNAQSAARRLALGQPTGNATTLTATRTGTKGTVQTLTKSVYVSGTGGTRVVTGSLLTAWRDLGAEKGKLGFPTANEKKVTGGYSQTFEKGSITVVDGETTIRYR